MKLTFVGTSHGAPQRDRHCSCYMIEAGDGLYFVDAGTSYADAMRDYGKDMSRLRAVFTTHQHSDHTAGMPLFVDLVNWYYKEADLTVVYPTQQLIDTTEGLLLVMLSYGGKLDRDRLHFTLAAPGRMYEDEHILMEYIATRHFKDERVPSYAIRITERATGKRVLFSGDLSHKLAEGDVPTEALRGCEVFVSELYHFDVEHLLPYLEGFAGRLCIHHLFERDVYRDELIAALNAHGSFSAFAPCDGESFEV